MFFSGIWKLAAMSGVVGVGLFAAYQAHKGMDKEVASATSAEVAEDDLSADSEAKELSSDKSPSAVSKDADPFGNNPFESSAAPQEPISKNKRPDQSTATTATATAADDEWADDANSKPAAVKPPAKLLADQEVKSASAEFESEFGASEPSAKTDAKPADEAAGTASLDGAQPDKLPDDLDVLEAEILRRRQQAEADLSAQKQTQKSAPKHRNGTVKTGDAALDQALQALPPAKQIDDDVQSFPNGPESALPNQVRALNRYKAEQKELQDEAAAGGQGAAPKAASEQSPVDPAAGPASSSDPFAGDPALEVGTKPRRKVSIPKVPVDDGVAAPQSAPNSDPFATDSSTSQPPQPLLGPPSDLKSVPAADDSGTPIQSRPSDPFSTSGDAADNDPAPHKLQPGRLPDDTGRRRKGNAAPKDVPLPLDPPADDQPARNDFPDPPPARKPAGLRLPTDVPDTGNVIPVGGNPPSNGAPEPRRLNPDPSAPPPSDDFLGDGTVSPSSPRGVQQPRVTIEKIAPKQGALGEPLVYSVIIKNIGGSEAQQVVIEDRIPKGTELTGTSPRAELIDHKLIWKIGTLKPNEEKKISIRVIPRQEGAVGSVARVSFATEVAADIVVVAPQLAFTVNAPQQVRMGESVELTFQLKNTGSAPATNVSVRDIVPEGLKHEAASDIECPIGRLEPGETREVVLAVTAVKPGRTTNRAILTGDAGIQQELETVINVVGELLALTRSGSNRIYVDRPTVFKNNVRNDGNSEVKQVRVSEIVPAGMEFVEASAGGRFDPVERAIYWNLGPLPAGAEAEVSAKLVARAPGAQQAKISVSGPSGSTAGIKSDVDVVGRPELQIETVSRTGQIAVGDRLTSRIQLNNNGSASAKNVVLSIRLPQELKLVEVRGQKYTVQNNVIKFDPIAAIVPKDAKSFEIVTEAIAEAETQINLEISADHLAKAARRSETVQISSEAPR